MKKLLASVGVLAIAAGANAQNSGDSFAELHDANADYTDGNNESTWKVANPSGPSDWWNSFKAGDLTGIAIDALAADFVELGGFTGGHAELGVYPDLGAGRPDINNAALSVVPSVNANDAFDTDAYYSVPKTTLTGTAGYHVAVNYVSGDSHTWVSSDNTAPIGRTFFTTTSYALSAIPFTTEIDLYVGSPRSGAPGALLLNGSTTASAEQDGGLVCAEFFGSALNTRFILYFCLGGNPFIQMLPAAFTVTDGALGGSCPFSWAACGQLDCNTPTATGLEFCTIWQDQLDLKPNGKAKLKVGASAFLDITPSGPCVTTGTGCFGQLDDCVLDANIWKVQNPAGPSDWFNVNHGVPTSGVTTLSSAGVSSYDFCSTGPCWAEVGIYPSNLSVDPTGTTPDVGNPLSNVTGASACMGISAADGSCPTTVYAGTPYIVDSAAAGGVHVAAQWPSADSCIWLGSDTDGIDSTCGTPIPNSGTTSLFTTTSYSSPGAQFTGANWMMQINWN